MGFAAGSDRREQAGRYVAPDPPSFSLGIDYGDDEGTEPVLTDGGHREEQAPRYEAPDAPSFSLGFDFGEESQLPDGARQEEQARQYEAPDAPSFSLGIDFDDESQLPDGGHREEQGRRYEAPDPPSFSLGFGDDDDDDGDEFLPGARTQVASRPPASLGVVEEEDDFFLAGGQQRKQGRHEALVPDPMPPPPETARFKRLRRGPAQPHLPPTPPPPRAPAPAATESSPVVSMKAALGAVGSLEDEIEDFTDEERPSRDVPQSVGSCSTSSNSKFSLLNHGVLMSQSTSKAKKFTHVPIFSASKPLEESSSKKLLPKITLSPMRKIHLLDSDTDTDDNKSENKAKKPVSTQKRQESMNKYVQKKPTLLQNSKSQENTAVQKSKAVLNDRWATPALDDFCNEYFKSVKDPRPSQGKEGSSFCGSKVTQSNYFVSETRGHFPHQATSSGAVLDDDLTEHHPPAMHYFFHHDPLVRELVRERLQHFVPVGADCSRGYEQNGTENINYRSQFNRSAATNDQWVTPNRRTSAATDVGRRRVHASGTQSGSGHWFTGDDGKKVYVSKNGQELTGRAAYKQYKKETGGGFRQSKKKGAKKGGSAGTKRGSTRAKKATSTAKQTKTTSKRKR